MASLQKIRNHGPLVIIVVGVAMLAFILGDVLSNVNSLKQGNETSVGTIAGNVVSWAEFEDAKNQMEQLKKYENQTIQLRDSSVITFAEYLSQNGIYIPQEITNEAVWETFKAYYTYKAQAEKMGLDLTPDEEMMMQNNFYMVPAHMSKAALLQQKYIALMRNTFHVNSLEAEFAFNGHQHGVSAQYVVYPYDAIADSLVEVSDSDIEKVYNKYKSQLKQNPTRTIEYVVINFVPSEEDKQREADFMEDVQEEFRTAEDIEDLLRSLDSDADFQLVNEYTAETVPAIFKDFAFGKDAKVGDATEILYDGSAYAMARIMDINKANKTVALAILKHTVLPSDATLADTEQKYKQLIFDNTQIEEFEQAVKELGHYPMTASLNEMTEKLGNLQNARSIVRRAFKTNEGEVCQEVFDCGDKLVVAAVLEASDDKYVPMEKVRHFLTVEAQNNAKAQYIQDNYNAASLEEASQAWGQPIQSVARISFDDASLEPALVGAALAQAENEVSGLVQGNMGIYIVKTGASIDTNEEWNEEAMQAEKSKLSNSLGMKFQQAIQYLQNETEAKIYNVERF